MNTDPAADRLEELVGRFRDQAGRGGRPGPAIPVVRCYLVVGDNEPTSENMVAEIDVLDPETVLSDIATGLRHLADGVERSHWGDGHG